MKGKIIYSAVFFMIFLIITLPFYISDVFAQDVSKIDKLAYPTPTGVANAPGYMMSSDVLTIIASLRAKGIADAEVASHLFFVAGDFKEPFTSCESQNSSWYSCIIQKPYIGLYPSVYEGNVILEAPSCEGCTKKFTITIDGKAPEVSNLDISPNMTKSGTVNVSYEITDSACDEPDCKDKCSGIDQVRFFEEKSYKNFQYLENVSENEKCSVSGIAEASISGLPSGQHSLCIAASDKAGNLNNATCKNITIDREPPVISDLRITDRAGKAFAYVPAEGVSARAEASITSDYANLLKAEIDLSSFHIPLQEMKCEKEYFSRVWNCKAEFIAILPYDSTSETVSIFTYDSAGNTEKKDFVFGLRVDQTPPAIKSIKTKYMFNDTPFIGKTDNEITIEFADAESGFNKNMTYIRGLGTYFDVASRDPMTLYQSYCSGSGGSWKCWWPAIELSTDKTSADLEFKVADDANNQLNFVKKIKIDQQKPSTVDVEMHTSNAYPAVGVGENVVMRLNLTDDSAIVDDTGNYNVYMDLTMLEGGTDMRKADSCVLVNASMGGSGLINSTQWVCTWIVSGAHEVSGWTPRVNVSDITGNLFEGYPAASYLAYISPVTGNLTFKSFPGGFDVYPVEANVSDYWKTSAGTSIPEQIDRQIAPVLETYVYTPILFSSIQDSPERIAVSLIGCDNDGTAMQFTLFPDDPISPYIETIVSSGDFSEIKKLTYNCTISIVSIANEMISKQEQDSFTIEIGLYNMPLGRIDTAMEDKVDQAKKFADNSFFKFLALLNKLFEWGSMLCKVYQTIGTITALIHAIGSLPPTWKEHCLLEFFPFCGWAAIAVATAEEQSDASTSVFENTVKRICDFLSCKWTSKAYQYVQEATKVNIDTVATSGGLAGKVAAGGLAFGGGFWPSDPTDSLVLSMLALCLPGVTHNFEKFRQIICQKGLCILTMSEQGGPLYSCDQMYHNQMCIAIVGEIFQLIPFYTVLRNIIGFFQSLFTNPLTFLFTIGWLACKGAGGPMTTAGSICNELNAMREVIGYVIDAFLTYKEVEAKLKAGWAGGDSCTPFAEKYKQLKELKGAQEKAEAGGGEEAPAENTTTAPETENATA